MCSLPIFATKMCSRGKKQTELPVARQRDSHYISVADAPGIRVRRTAQTSLVIQQRDEFRWRCKVGRRGALRARQGRALQHSWFPPSAANGGHVARTQAWDAPVSGTRAPMAALTTPKVALSWRHAPSTSAHWIAGAKGSAIFVSNTSCGTLREASTGKRNTPPSGQRNFQVIISG